MSAEIDSKEMVKNNESALDVAYEETDLEEVKPEIDHSKLYVWIADSGNDRIQKFDGNGKFISQFGSSGGTRPPYQSGEFKAPSGVTIDAEGNIWVVDSGCHRIRRTGRRGSRPSRRNLQSPDQDWCCSGSSRSRFRQPIPSC